jgi:hypothetical protein
MQRGRKGNKGPMFEPSTVKPEPRVDGTPPKKTDVLTGQGRYSQRQWRQMSKFERYWANHGGPPNRRAQAGGEARTTGRAATMTACTR